MEALVAFLRARLAEDRETVARLDELASGHTHPYDPRNPCDPSRVLARIRVTERLVGQFVLRGDSVRATVRPATGGVWDDLLRILAQEYSDHPDFRADWAE